MDEKEVIERKLFSDTSRYNDIIDRPYQHSRAHLPMTNEDRAMQFSPFAALTGFNGLIRERAVNYKHKQYLSAAQQAAIRQQLQVGRTLVFDYFDGQSGYYQEIRGTIKKIVPQRGRLWLTDGDSLVIASIRAVRLANHE
ncbi:hypothetical protein [Limosilactobacillus secaliphilus]|uniref:YolD-like protein n=1 Tax=Limosilactobacillus secaliphilus TaxID=396268 RepID=A0A0R2I915_9LACO|nr:hypothetical protein [Limosilactobacillus secaliphilus]KRN58378.1 hypothetical protein IV45_GL000824 [Limosilactobacillus secaliphilus]